MQNGQAKTSFYYYDNKVVKGYKTFSGNVAIVSSKLYINRREYLDIGP